MAEVTLVAEDNLEVSEVLKESPQIDQSKAWRMYVNGTKNSIGA